MRKTNQYFRYIFVVLALSLFMAGCDVNEIKETENAGESILSVSTPVPTTTEIPTATPVETPKASPLAEPTEKPWVTAIPFASFDIQSELQTVENKYQELQNKIQTDASLNQADMNILAGECATLWENALDNFWYVLEPLLTWEEVRDLHVEQQEWLTMRDKEVQDLIDKYDGGSLTGLVVGQKKAELARTRTYELADKLKQIAKRMAEAKSRDYSGYYVNTEGTDSVYDELKLELLEDGTYKAELGIYRLVLLEGTATVYGDMLVFVDDSLGVTGNIQFREDKAIFTVTESDFEYLTPGEGFEFIKSK